MKCNLTMMLCLCGLLLSSCGGGGGPQPVPGKSTITTLYHGNQIRISAGPGSADPGTTVEAVSGGFGETTVNPDGSFSFDVDTPPSQTDVFVNYVKQGFELSGISSPRLMASLVSQNAFATGSGPNDLLYRNGSLYAANSLDNTISRHDLAGNVLATAVFPEFSSPSYICADSSSLYAVLNGSDRIVRLTTLSLEFDPVADAVGMLAPALAFIGPGSAVAHKGHVYVPRSQVQEFSAFGSGDPTTYADGVFSDADFNPAQPLQTEHATAGRNPQFCEYDAPLGLLVVVSGGELNFTADFTPYVSTDSYVELYRIDGTPGLVDSINLGPAGAGAIAITPDGKSAYIGNAVNGNLYKVDLAGRTLLRGITNPIVLSEQFTYISDVEVTADGRYVLATSFNTDELYIFPTATDLPGSGAYPDPLDMSQGADLLAGASGVELDGQGHAFVLNAIANSVNRIELLP